MCINAKKIIWNMQIIVELEKRNKQGPEKQMLFRALCPCVRKEYQAYLRNGKGNLSRRKDDAAANI